ncbi:MAG: DUF1570 domain-containing protein [Planctomycetota bacterium]|jgi:hypothetical protein
MRIALKAAVVVLPFLAVFLAIRSCSEGEAERWRLRAAEVDPDAMVGVEEEDLIVVAPARALAEEAAGEIRGFRRALEERYGDLLGRPRHHRMVVVLFSTVEQLGRYAGDRMLHDPQYVARIHGYTDPVHGAIFLPPESRPRTLRHEVVHWIMDTSHGGGIAHSPWLHEGLAQLFETYEPGTRPPGIGPEDRIRMRRSFEGDTLDVERLIHLDDYRAFVVEDGARNYLASLVLTAFLFHERPRELLQSYVHLERSSPTGRPAAFHTLYRHSEEPFRRDLRAFIRRMKGQE